MVRNWFRKLTSRPEPRRERAVAERPSLTFREVESTLALYVKALSDSTLKVNSSALARRGSYSDGRTVFVPPEIDLFHDLAEARRLYRVMSAWKVLQVRSGSIDIEKVPDPVEQSATFVLYEILSGEWIDRTMATTWPGLGADLMSLRQDALARRMTSESNQHGNGVETLLRALLQLPLDRPLREADIHAVLGETESPSPDPVLRDMLLATGDMLNADHPEESLKLATEFAAQNGHANASELASAIHYRGRIRPDVLKPPEFDVDGLKEENQRGKGRGNRRPPKSDPLQVEARQLPRAATHRRRQPSGGRQSVQLSLADREPTRSFAQVPLSDEEKAGAHLYQEWDYRRNMYLPEWCALRTRRPRGGNSEKVEQILRQHSALIRHLKQQFEALRPERLRLNRQLDGDEIDLNAFTEAHADRMAGISPTDKLYSQTLEKERNIAVACLLDLSGSTGAWIDDDPRNDQVIEVTRRGVVFLCEALSVLDDRHAVYGFTGSTRKHSEFSIVKGFDESYGETVKGRIAGLSPGAYTRMGPAIRHAAHNLATQAARVRILMLITDGRPNDFDGYGGRYGIEDTRRALIEARQMGVNTFALTIDAEARDYMPYIFGVGHYIVIEDTPALATKLSEVYRKLTVQ